MHLSMHKTITVEMSKILGALKRRIRVMTAITPVYAHAYQATCLTRRLPANLCRYFRLLKPKAKYPYLPNVRSATREWNNDFRRWAIYTNEELAA